MDAVKQRIEQVRRGEGLTPNAFAKLAKIDPSGFYRKINGSEPVTPKNIDKIVSAFGVRREWLLHGTGDMRENAAILPPSVTQMNDHVQGDAYNVNNGTECAALMKEVEMLRQENAWLRSLVEKKLQINN